MNVGLIVGGILAIVTGLVLGKKRDTKAPDKAEKVVKPEHKEVPVIDYQQFPEKVSEIHASDIQESIDLDPLGGAGTDASEADPSAASDGSADTPS